MANQMASMNVAPDYSYDGETASDYCPCLYLNEEQCEALGLSTLEAGTVIGLTVRCLVQRATSSVDDEDDDEPDVSMSLKVTDAQVVATPEPGARTDMKSAAATMYGKADTD